MAVPVFVSKVVIENSIDVEAASPKPLTVGLTRGLVKISTTRTAKVPAGEVGRETYPSGSTWPSYFGTKSGYPQYRGRRQWGDPCPYNLGCSFLAMSNFQFVQNTLVGVVILGLVDVFFEGAGFSGGDTGGGGVVGNRADSSTLSDADDTPHRLGSRRPTSPQEYCPASLIHRPRLPTGLE